MPYSLGSAISENYKTPQSDIGNSLVKGFQLEQMGAARRESERLKREAAQAKEDATFAKSIESIDMKDIHPYVLEKAKSEVAPLIAEATNLYRQDPRKNHIKISQKLQEAQNKVYENKALSDNVKRFDTTKDENLTSAGKHFKDVLNKTGNIQALNGMSDPVTGEGVNNNQFNFQITDYADINKVRNDVFSKVKQDIISQKNLGNNQREFSYGIPKEVVDQTAQELWSDDRVRHKFFDEHREYLIGKYYKGVPKELRSEKAMLENPDVQADLYKMFLSDTEKAAGKFGEKKMDAIPQATHAPYQKTPNEVWTKTAVGTTGAGRESFNERYKTNYTEAQWGGMSDQKGNADYIAIEPKSGKADTESLLLDINGKPFKPQGYKIEGDKLYAKGALNEPVSTGVDSYGKPKLTDKYVPKTGIELSPQNTANVAAHYGFSDVNKFKDWLKGDNSGSKTNSGKELKGTSAQLEAAAKKKGLSKDAYKQQLTKAGYTVIES